MKRPPRLRNNWPNIGAVSVHLVVGLVVVILGILFLVSNLHVVDIYSPSHYFLATVCVAIGLAFLIERRNERSWQWGVGWIVAGLWTFAYQRRWIDVGFWQVVVPLLMLAAGAFLVRRALNERNPQTIVEGGRKSHVVQGVGVLSASELKPSHAVDRAELFAMMGGVKLDLFETQLINNTATIHVAALMGGIEICAPSEWIVTSRVVPIMGAFVDKRRPAAAMPVPEQAKTLIIDGFVLMGGIEVKN
jgi:predicted membrane protein